MNSRYVSPLERCVIEGEAWANTVYEPANHALRLTYVYVPPSERRSGIARRLLEEVVVIAEECDVLKIVGEIVSREGLDLSVSCFGQKAVNVTRLGTYADGNPYESARAELNYYLQ